VSVAVCAENPQSIGLLGCLTHATRSITCYVLTNHGDARYAPVRATHHGGTLDEAPVDVAGIVTCLWHGHRFDVRTGRRMGSTP
jgi:nitrite reductase/ring-hydroxylating ferredoxin subunit